MPNSGSPPEINPEVNPKKQALGIILLVGNLFVIQGIVEIVPGFLNRFAYSFIFTVLYWIFNLILLSICCSQKENHSKPL